MTEFNYIIDSVTDKEGNPKEKADGRFFIKFIKIGSRAVLCKNDWKTSVMTSTVEDIRIWENSIVITTTNSIYNLEMRVK